VSFEITIKVVDSTKAPRFLRRTPVGTDQMNVSVYLAATTTVVVSLVVLNLCRRVVLPLVDARSRWTCDSTPVWFVEGRTRTMITIRGTHRGYRFEAVHRTDARRSDEERHRSEATLHTDLRMPYAAIRFPGMGRRPTLHGDLTTVAVLRGADDAAWLPTWQLSGSQVSMRAALIHADWQGPLRSPGLLRRLDLLVDIVEGYRNAARAGTPVPEPAVG
jgi:hypothetical protein